MPRLSDDNHRVVSLRPRRAKSRGTARRREPIRRGDPGILLSLAKFERDGREDEYYRQRMVLNVLAFIVLLALTVIGVWLAVNINDQHHVLAPSDSTIETNVG
jgi:hypothetical protein